MNNNQNSVANQALDLLVKMFDLYEDGENCYDVDSEGCSCGYLGKAISLDIQTFEQIAGFLNKYPVRR